MDSSILADAGRLADGHAMFWLRRLEIPPSRAWQLVSTLDGLTSWWIVPPRVLELRPGGRFEHHWDNTVRDYAEEQFIDFAENTGAYAGTGGMRFELRADGERSTLFMFLDTWGPTCCRPTVSDRVSRADRARPGPASRPAGTP